MASIVMDRVSKEFRGGVLAVNDVSLTVEDGEFMVLVGPSGCGKTTLLRMIAGLEDVSVGEIYIDGKVMTDASPKDRDVAMVFQNYALYPHMTVEQNIGLGLRLRHVGRAETSRRVHDVAKVLALDDLLKRKPAELSGGQRQRVAMGRAIIREPKAFLMDEPLSNLDAKLRVQMRTELARIHQRLHTTTVYVTHDQVEAMTLGDRVAVLNDGVLQQVAPPTELYERPANLFVGAFIGSPAMNLVHARIESGFVAFGRQRLRTPNWYDVRTAREVILGIRPSDLDRADSTTPEGAVLDVVPDVIEELGSEINVIFRVEARPAVTADTVAASSNEGRAEALMPLVGDEAQHASFTARLDPRSSARIGERLRLTVDPERLHLFDPESGTSLKQAPVAAAVNA